MVLLVRLVVQLALLFYPMGLLVVIIPNCRSLDNVVIKLVTVWMLTKSVVLTHLNQIHYVALPHSSIVKVSLLVSDSINY